MAWAVIGFLGSLLLGAFAYSRSRVPGGFFDTQVYGMTARTHRSYAIAGLMFAGVFAAAWVFKLQIEIAAFTAFVLVAIFYLTSFLRGAHEDDG